MIGFLGLGRALDRLKLNRLKDGLAKTRDQLGAIFAGRRLDESWFDDVETALLTADVGSQASTDLMRDVRQEIKAHGLNDDSPPEALRQAVANCIERALSPLAGDGLTHSTSGAVPNVVLVAGIVLIIVLAVMMPLIEMNSLVR